MRPFHPPDASVLCCRLKQQTLKHSALSRVRSVRILHFRPEAPSKIPHESARSPPTSGRVFRNVILSRRRRTAFFHSLRANPSSWNTSSQNWMLAPLRGNVRPRTKSETTKRRP